MPRVTDPTKRVTDPVAISHLQRQGKDPGVWEFAQDYAMPRVVNGKREKGKSPYAKFYLNTDNPRERMAVISGLPMVDADGVRCEPQWVQAGNTYHQKNNVFSALVNDIPGRITLTCKNDQPDGVRKKNDRVVFSPQLFVNGVEIPRPSVTLLAVDPRNPNYLENTLEWDYGVCKRHLRTVEGRIHGYWIFPSNPGGEVMIVYNQTGQYRLRLGRYAIDDDTEVIPASVFDDASYPFEVSDSSTFNPDADPETTSVDGMVRQNESATGVVWASLRDGAGNGAFPSSSGSTAFRLESGTGTNKWTDLERGIILFDTSGLNDNATIDAATLSIYGRSKANTFSPAANVQTNIYSSAPASNTNIVAGDYDSLGTTQYSDSPISYTNWSTSGYNDWALNATGIAAISKTGISKFGSRDNTYDVGDSPPTWESAKAVEIDCYYSEQGAGYKPKLAVTFSSPLTVTTQAVSGILTTTAIGHGNVTNVGDGVTEHGHCWGLFSNPTTADSKTTLGTKGSTGTFNSSITGLTANTLYHVRAYATDSIETDYGADVTFTTLADATVDPSGSIDVYETGLRFVDAYGTRKTLNTTFSRIFHVNQFHFPDPISEWRPTIYGAYLPASLTAKKCWLPLNFLKVGDIITAYNLVGDAIETNALTLDCKLVQVNKADPLTTTDITNGGMVQVIADGNFDVAVNPDDTTVATDKQYVLELLGTTGVADEIYVTGAEVTITRLI